MAINRRLEEVEGAPEHAVGGSNRAAKVVKFSQVIVGDLVLPIPQGYSDHLVAIHSPEHDEARHLQLARER